MANGGRQIPEEDVLADFIVQEFLAQQDVTRVQDPREEQIPQGELENFIMNLIQGADPSMGVFSGMAGLTPDDPDFKTQILIGLLTGGGLGALLRAGGRRIGSMTGAVARKLDPRPAIREAGDLLSRGPTSQAIRKGEAFLSRNLDESRRLDIFTQPGRLDKAEELAFLQEIRADRVGRETIERLTPSQQAVTRRQLTQEVADTEARRLTGNRALQDFQAAEKRLADFDRVVSTRTPGTALERTTPPVRGELGGTGTGVSSSFQDMTMGELADLVESSIRQVEIDEAAALRSRFRPSGEIPQGGSGVGRASRAIGSGSRDIESIREQIFRDILERGGGDPFGEAEGIHEGIVEQIQRLIQRRLGN